MRKGSVELLMKRFGGSFSSMLGINLSKAKPNEVFKWFLASILFGARISETIAINTYKQFEVDDLLDTEKIIRVDWDSLVKSLDAGGYVRYDFKTADKLLEVMKNLKTNYNGNLNLLHEQASDPRDLEEKIKNLGKGIGDITANIFLRELRGIWKKANPLPQDLVIIAARKLGYTKLRGKNEIERAKILEDLRQVWAENKLKGRTFIDFEAALLRYGKNLRRKPRITLV
jgi:hypothetical protein